MDNNNNEEKFWLTDFNSLFKEINFMPYGDVGSGGRLNAITRIIIVVYIIMLICKYKYAHTFFIISIIFIITVYLCFKDKSIKGLHINTREPFVLDEQRVLNNNKEDLSSNMNTNKETQQYYNKEYQLYPKKTYNMFNTNYDRFKEQNVFANTFDQKLILPTTKTDKEAGIQYYTPDVGTNDRMFIEPIIAPRSLDREVWSYPSVYPSGMNTDTLYDVTQANNFPNNVNNYKQYEYGKFDYVRDERPLFKGIGNWESDSSSQNPMITLREQEKINKEKNEEKKINISTKYIQPNEQLNKMNSNLYQNNLIDQSQGNPDLIQSSYSTTNPSSILNKEIGGKQNVSSIQNVLNKNQTTGNYMIDPSPTYIYTDKYFNQPQKRLFLQDVQPNQYSYSVEQTPINSNIGITYTPQIPPKFRDQVYTDNKGYPVLTRIEPELVRDSGLTNGQLASQPERNGISAKYSNWNPPAGSINFEQIYDPRFTSYGDGTRAYSDINTGQVQYYYSDIDAYRRPNFLIRSNVDYIDYQTPNGDVKPYYERTTSLEDVKDIVENRFDADQLYFREDLMASQMAKRNSEEYQLRMAPLRKQNNSRSYTYGPY
jgi:hypothetical protein